MVRAAQKRLRRRGWRAARSVTLIVNGAARQLSLAPRTSLLDALRDQLKLTGTKKGVRPRPVRGLRRPGGRPADRGVLTLAVMKDGAKITTIEGLAGEAGLHPLQQAFVDS